MPPHPSPPSHGPRDLSARPGWRTVPAGIGAVLLLALLGFGASGALFGVGLGAQELRRAPAVLAFVALMVLLRGPHALPEAAGWSLLGAAGAVALRALGGTLGQAGWIPGEVTPPAMILAEAGWLLLLAGLAWTGAAARLLGPALAACVATTRIGDYGQALVPVAWETSMGEAAVLGLGILAGLAAGLLAMLLAGWGLAILARIPERLVRPARVLGALAAAAAIGHMVRL